MVEPLTDRQKYILSHVIAGTTHEEIANHFGVVKTAVTNDLRQAAFRMNAVNTASAVAKWTEAQTLRECAVRLRKVKELRKFADQLDTESEGIAP